MTEDPLIKEEQKLPLENNQKEELGNTDKTKHPNLRNTRWRFAFLALCCASLVGLFFCYDNPAPVEMKIKAVNIRLYFLASKISNRKWF